MHKGVVVPATSIRMIYDNSSVINADYKAPKGRRFVFLLLGDESKDESDRMDPEAALRSLGWNHIASEKKETEIL